MDLPQAGQISQSMLLQSYMEEIKYKFGTYSKYPLHKAMRDPKEIQSRYNKQTNVLYCI